MIEKIPVRVAGEMNILTRISNAPTWDDGCQRGAGNSKVRYELLKFQAAVFPVKFYAIFNPRYPKI